MDCNEDNVFVRFGDELAVYSIRTGSRVYEVSLDNPPGWEDGKISCSNTIVAKLDASSLTVWTCTQAGVIENLFKINYQYPTNNIVTELKGAGSKIAFILSDWRNRTAVLHVFDGEVEVLVHAVSFDPFEVISWPMSGWQS